jgi:6-phosphogluconolactonase
MQPNRFSPDVATPITRPDCKGLRAAPIAHSETADATVLYFASATSSDDHAVPYDHWFAVLRGAGRISIRDQSQAVRAGDVVLLPAGVFHRLWTEGEEMDALALVFQLQPGPELVRVPDRTALARNAAERFVMLARQAIAEHRRFSVALSGGSTPQELYALLAQPEFAGQVNWERVHVFWGDERDVPSEDLESNYRMAFETLGRLPIPASQVHRIPTELGSEQAATAYEHALRDFFKVEGDHFPSFDLVLLGMGANGHTASLFPHSPALNETTHWVVSQYVDEVKMNRITLTAPILNAADNILFLVSGQDKAETVHAVLRGEYRPNSLPAQLIQPTHGQVVWLLDWAAASRL